MKIQLFIANKHEITNRGICLTFSMNENNIKFIEKEHTIVFEDVEYTIKSIESIRAKDYLKANRLDAIALMVDVLN